MGSLKRNIANNILSGGKFDATDLSGTIPASNVNNDSLTNVTSFSPSLGDTIQSVASDPTPASTGDIWFNSTEGVLKGYLPITATHSASSLGTARYNAAAGGTTSAAWIAGGYPSTTNTEEYNGSGWSSSGSLNTSRGGLIGTGLQTAGLAMGGGPGSAPYTSAVVEEYDGSTWTSVTSLSTERLYAGASGTQTSGAIFCGSTTPNASVRTSATEEYDGTNWTSGGTVNSAQGHVGGCGTQTAGLKAGGDDPGGSSNTSEEYNGTSWTTGNTLNTARRADGLSGLQTNAVLMGGYAPGASTGYTNIEEYDGTSFSNSSASLAAVTYYNTTAGNTSGSSVLSAGGKVSGSTSVVTEEYNSSINVVTGAAWSSGGNLGTARYSGAGAGVQDAGLMIGGMEYSAPAGVNLTEEYDGSSWTAGGTINRGTNARTGFGSSGTQTASAIFGGAPVSGGSSATEHYDGSTWTNVPGTLNTARYWLGSNGTQTSALAYGGTSTSPAANSPTDATEEYDGSTWTVGGNLSQTRYLIKGFGTQTAAAAAGGQIVTPPSLTTQTEEYNGTSWSSGGNLITGRRDGGTTGSQTSGIMFAGQSPPSTTLTSTEIYDGSIWSTNSSMATGRYGLSSSETSSTTNAFAAGGTVIPYNSTAATEEFTGEVVTATASTISTE